MGGVQAAHIDMSVPGVGVTSNVYSRPWALGLMASKIGVQRWPEEFRIIIYPPSLRKFCLFVFFFHTYQRKMLIGGYGVATGRCRSKNCLTLQYSLVSCDII